MERPGLLGRHLEGKSDSEECDEENARDGMHGS